MKKILIFLFIIISLLMTCVGENDSRNDLLYDDSDKANLLGNWILIQTESELLKQFQDTVNWNFPSDYADQFNEKEFLGQDLSLEARIRFENDSILSLSNENKYYYQFDENTLILIKSDYVIGYNYEMKDDLLIITEKLSTPIKRILTFKKKKNNKCSQKRI
ncbi:hypothetical protein [Flexithrix dorotheae]|uniref:hypothetical protein n=1 Tax=Flexithrix dorotheae TaxID=70993 RepID=UPI0012FC4F36|nr:hypothetical protein [Flexithrix dorotheae]